MGGKRGDGGRQDIHGSAAYTAGLAGKRSCICTSTINGGVVIRDMHNRREATAVDGPCSRVSCQIRFKKAVTRVPVFWEKYRTLSMLPLQNLFATT